MLDKLHKKLSLGIAKNQSSNLQKSLYTSISSRNAPSIKKRKFVIESRRLELYSFQVKVVIFFMILQKTEVSWTFTEVAYHLTLPFWLK